MARQRFDTHEVLRFSRRWWLGQVRSFAWVAIVTVLIWVYADMEVADVDKITLTVRLTPGNSQDLVLLSRSDEKVSVVVRGARASLKNFTGKYSNAVLPYDISRYEPGRNQVVPMADVLSQIPDIVSLGLEVVSTTPTAITGVHLDKRIRRNVPVEFEYSKAVLEQPPKPATIGISLAETQWQEILDKQPTPGAQPVLKTVEETFENVKTGEPIQVEWRIIPFINGVEVTPDQKTLTTAVVVKELTGTKSISVPVRVLLPPSWLEDGTLRQYVLKRKDPLDWTKEIQVSGPVKDLDKLNAGNISAYVVLTDEEKKPVESWLPGEVIVRFPEELKVKLAEKPAPVQFKLEKVQPVNP